jgi:hypothetical protein
MTEESTAVAMDDFNLDTDVVEEPLIPNGNYSANVTAVTLDTEKHAIVWKLVLQGNEGSVMADGETEVDGAVVFFRNWLPKPGDDAEMTSSGKMTKRQSKLNQLAKFTKAMNLDVVTMADIVRCIDEAEWIGKEVIASVAIREWQGSFSNEVTKMVEQK